MTKKQHYIPQFYLRNFVDNSQMLWVYNRGKDNFFHVPPKDICKKDCLYETLWEDADPKLGKYVLPNQIEKSFAKNENEFNKILKEIISICKNPQKKNTTICNKENRKILSRFVVNMFLRNPYSLNQINCFPEEVMKNKEIQSINESLQFLGVGSTKSLIKAAIKNVCLNEEYKVGIPELLLNELLNFNYSFFVSKEEEFVTSSFPVIFKIYGSEDGITPSKYSYLPLHPNVALFYSDSLKEFRNRIKFLSKNYVKQLNTLYLKIDTKKVPYIIAHKKSTLEDLIG